MAIDASIASGIGLIAGLAVHAGYITLIRDKKILESAEGKSKLIIDKAQTDAKALNQKAELDARDYMLSARKDMDKELQGSRKEIKKLEQQVSSKEERLEKKLEKVDRNDREVEKLKSKLQTQTSDLEKRRQEIISKLEQTSGLSQDDAKAELLSQVEGDFRVDIEEKMKLVVEGVKEQAKEKALNVMAHTIQKVSIDYQAEALVSVVPIANDEMKGRIIGREGRNIRAFEQVTGIDVIIDDTPGVVVLSGFNAVRRATAARTLQILVEDGRIHPARIEEVYKKVEKEIDDECIKAGEKAAADVGVHRLHKNIVKTLGRLKFRTSYGQNVLEHSVECAQIAGTLAAEIGANAKLAKRASLLHDLGKVIEGDESSHAQLGADLAKKCGEKPVICNAIAAHHEEVDMESPIAFLVAASDSISASRRGARRGQTENYVERLQNLEDIATSCDGVSSAFAIQAGRELRVVVNPDAVDDSKGVRISHDIVQRIESELDYPGQIKVVVVRENRFVDYAF
ncbi:MAG: ribonuclease Y [Candidatus Cloacimonetes bacterium]|nr:ribonuclease Y [Candidatus Cloacimonadota bacterium]